MVSTSDKIDKQEVKDLLYWLSNQLEEDTIEIQREYGTRKFVAKTAISGRIYRLQKALYNDKLREHLLEESNND